MKNRSYTEDFKLETVEQITERGFYKVAEGSA